MSLLRNVNIRPSYTLKLNISISDEVVSCISDPNTFHFQSKHQTIYKINQLFRGFSECNVITNRDEPNLFDKIVFDGVKIIIHTNRFPSAHFFARLTFFNEKKQVQLILNLICFSDSVILRNTSLSSIPSTSEIILNDSTIFDVKSNKIVAKFENDRKKFVQKINQKYFVNYASNNLIEIYSLVNVNELVLLESYIDEETRLVRFGNEYCSSKLNNNEKSRIIESNNGSKPIKIDSMSIGQSTIWITKNNEHYYVFCFEKKSKSPFLSIWKTYRICLISKDFNQMIEIGVTPEILSYSMNSYVRSNDGHLIVSDIKLSNDFNSNYLKSKFDTETYKTYIFSSLTDVRESIKIPKNVKHVCFNEKEKISVYLKQNLEFDSIIRLKVGYTKTWFLCALFSK